MAKTKEALKHNQFSYFLTSEFSVDNVPANHSTNKIDLALTQRRSPWVLFLLVLCEHLTSLFSPRSNVDTVLIAPTAAIGNVLAMVVAISPFSSLSFVGSRYGMAVLRSAWTP